MLPYCSNSLIVLFIQYLKDFKFNVRLVNRTFFSKFVPFWFSEVLFLTSLGHLFSLQKSFFVVQPVVCENKKGFGHSWISKAKVTRI